MFKYFSGCYVYEAVPEEEIKKLDTRSAFIGPVADCYLQCMSHFGVNVSTLNGKLKVKIL